MEADEEEDNLRILLLGNGGREHALAWSLSRSSRVDAIFVVPGNGGTAHRLHNVENIDHIKPDDFSSLVRFARDRSVNLVIPGPEVPLVNGIADFFRRGKAFGCPLKECISLTDAGLKPVYDVLDPARLPHAWKAQKHSRRISCLDTRFPQRNIRTSVIMRWPDNILKMYLMMWC